MPIAAILAVFLSVGLAVAIVCPPLWRDYDGLIQITSKPNDMTLLQYPAAYPFFSRMHVYAAEIVQGWRDHQKVTIHSKRVVALNDAGIRALMISQEILLALALAAFVASSAKSPVARWSSVALLLSNASIFIMGNLISTEALAASLTVALVAISIWLFRAEKLPIPGLIAYTLCLYVAIMTRHANAIFAMLLPLAFIFRAAMNGFIARPATRAAFLKVLLFCALGFLSIAADQLTTRLLCKVYGVEYRTITARATSERLGFVNQMPPAEREAFLTNLQASTTDPVIKEAIPLLTRPASWVQQREEILTILRRDSSSTDDEKLKIKADAYLDQIAKLYYHTHNHYLVQDILDSIWHGLAATTPLDVSTFYLKDGAWSIDLYAGHPEFDKKTHGLEVCSPAAQSRIESFEQNPWLQIWRWAPHGLTLIVSAILATFLLLRKTGDAALPLFALACVGTAITATVLTFILTNYGARFTAVADLFAFLSLAMVVAHWLDSRRGPASAA